MGTAILRVIKKNLFGIITAILSAGILLAFLFSSDGISSLGRVSQSIRYEWLLLAVAAAVAAWILEGVVLNLFCRAVYREWKFRYSFCIGMEGDLYSALTPFSTGGQPMQIYSMHKLGMDTGAAGSIIAVKTLVYQIILVLYSLVMVVWMLPFFQTNISNFSFVTILGLICNSTFILLVLLFCISKRATDMLLRKGIGLLHKLHLCRHPEERYEKIHRELAVFHESSFLLGKSWKLYAGAGLLTVVQIASTCSIPYFIYRGFGFSQQPVSVIMAAQAYVSMVSAFVPLPGASGGAEGSFVLFFRSFFLDGTIIPATVVWRTISYYLNFPVGCICTYLVGRMPKLTLSGAKKADGEKAKELNEQNQVEA